MKKNEPSIAAPMPASLLSELTDYRTDIDFAWGNFVEYFIGIQDRTYYTSPHKKEIFVNLTGTNPSDLGSGTVTDIIRR